MKIEKVDYPYNEIYEFSELKHDPEEVIMITSSKGNSNYLLNFANRPSSILLTEKELYNFCLKILADICLKNDSEEK